MAKQIHQRMEENMYEALAKYAEDNGMSVQDSISQAVAQMLNKQAQAAVPPDAGFTFIDLFAGIGGMRIAYESAGGHCVYSNEWNKYSQQTYFANFGEQPEGDITKVDAASIPDHDILVAGFPCQPFSIAGVSKKNSLGRATGFEDKTQGTLFFDICRILKEKRPKAFMLENVKNLCSHDRGNTFRVITEALDELDYAIFYRVLDGQNYVPQHRERILIVGFVESFIVIIAIVEGTLQIEVWLEHKVTIIRLEGKPSVVCNRDHTIIHIQLRCLNNVYAVCRHYLFLIFFGLCKDCC